jgi:catechol 2,3-dioxygenase-like lactoylglutathione lyase family enzyme
MTFAIDHVGFIVPNLEEAIAHWTSVFGYEFAPITRYTTTRYSDRNNPTPHVHDARKTVSRQGPPRIELLEATGEGTHSLANAGPHHLGVRGVDNLPKVMADMAALGLADDGCSYAEDGEMLLFFTDKGGLDGMRIEFIGNRPGPVFADDGRALPIDPATGRADVWAAPLG